METAESIRGLLGKQGIDLVGFTSAEKFEDWDDIFHKRLEDGSLPSLYREELNADPCALLPGARSIIVFGISHDLVEGRDPKHSSIAGYFWVRKKRQAVSALLAEHLVREGHRAFADSSTQVDIPAKPAAVRAGLAVQRKNTLTFFDGLGSAVQIGTVVTDLELPTDQTLDLKLCGECSLCLDACPTSALTDDYVLDARRCLCHMTEQDSNIPLEIRPALGNRVMGCDACQVVCPHNVNVPRTSLGDIQWLDLMSLAVAAIEEPEDLKRRFREECSSLYGDYVLMRTIAINLGNWGDPKAAPLLEGLRESPWPEVAEAARWSLDQIRN